MSYDIHLADPATGETLHLDKPHKMGGGTYIVGGTTECWLNITWNYAPHYYRIMGEKGIRTIYGMTGAESIPILQDAIAKLSDDISPDYWESTEGNAKLALINLLTFAQAKPEGVWRGD